MLVIRLEKQYRKTLDNKGLRMFTIAEAGPRLEGLKPGITDTVLPTAAMQLQRQALA